MTATILVVDDEPDLEALVLQKFRRQIREGTVNFVFAHDGLEALQIPGKLADQIAARYPHRQPVDLVWNPSRHGHLHQRDCDGLADRHARDSGQRQRGSALRGVLLRTQGGLRGRAALLP